eukprot:CAMPEP_0181347388 /NCGR_PEP_ID=MMETSP1101-20121128/33852_1 /TAXON_ID=46948 /ORGANISM="Rhodomonas abbreviata, Strain Caron Lab Isolate" /LENGTH=497 /DNA_ID=CAMNT_0023459599 /DNA_START=505 /DNA_END=1998 /DNA_ORIENTATION=-
MTASNSEENYGWMISFPFILMASTAGCAWFRRRRINRRLRHVEERHIQQAVSISIQNQRLETMADQGAGIRHHTTSPHIVPRAAPVDGKLEGDSMIDLAEISIEDETSLKQKYTEESYFQMKLTWLECQLRKLHRSDAKVCKMEVDRNDIFHDSFRAFSKLSGEQLRGPLELKFKREDGRDDGGLTRHWFMLISREVVNPEYALFIPMGKNHAFQVNSASKHQPHHLEYFRFIGRVWGKALFDGFLIESHLASTIYKYLLDRKIGPNDMMTVDNVYFTSLQWILDNDVDESGMELNFVVDEEELGTVRQVVLKEGGETELVTNENKEEYVRLVCEERLVKCIQPQLDALKEGFYEIVPRDVLSKFSETELELVLCGLPVIDIEDWQANCEYRAGYSAEHEVMQWFWELLDGWDQEMRARMLQFVTGTSKVPTGGFGGLYGATGPKRFQIIRVINTNRLPQANTCFNELLLPPYSSKERLAHCLAMSLYDGGDTFGLR